MTTYGEYAMKHPLVKLDENAFYHEITPKAYKILELHKHIPQDIKDVNKPSTWGYHLQDVKSCISKVMSGSRK